MLDMTEMATTDKGGMTKTARSISLARGGKAPAEIAKMLDTTSASVRVTLAKARKSDKTIPRQRSVRGKAVYDCPQSIHIKLSAKLHKKLMQEARRCGISPRRLAERVLGVALRDKMIAAILDTDG